MYLRFLLAPSNIHKRLRFLARVVQKGVLRNRIKVGSGHQHEGGIARQQQQQLFIRRGRQSATAGSDATHLLEIIHGDDGGRILDEGGGLE